MKHTRTMSAPAPVSPPADVEKQIRIRAARAVFTSAIGTAMLANVAAGVAPRWWKLAPPNDFDRWAALDWLEGLTPWCGPTSGPVSELREMLELVRPHVPTSVYGAGVTLATMLDAL